MTRRGHLRLVPATPHARASERDVAMANHPAGTRARLVTRGHQPVGAGAHRRPATASQWGGEVDGTARLAAMARHPAGRATS